MKNFTKLVKKYSDRELAMHYNKSIDQIRHARRRLFILRGKEQQTFKSRAMRGIVKKI